jgi:hypothetical protein
LSLKKNNVLNITKSLQRLKYSQKSLPGLDDVEDEHELIVNDDRRIGRSGRIICAKPEKERQLDESAYFTLTTSNSKYLPTGDYRSGT